jgi:hypothetical protein
MDWEVPQQIGPKKESQSKQKYVLDELLGKTLLHIPLIPRASPEVVDFGS